MNRRRGAALAAGKEERAEVAQLLSRFLSGGGSPWEFDDFISCRSRDPVIEAVRVELQSIPDAYPPVTPGPFANQAGIARIASLADSLRSA